MLSSTQLIFPEALDKGEGFVKDKVVLSGVGDTASRQSLGEDQDLQASRRITFRGSIAPPTIDTALHKRP